MNTGQTHRILNLIRRQKREIIFQVDISQENREESNIRIPLEQNIELQNKINQILVEELPNRLNAIYGIKTEVIIKETRTGSLIVIFGVLLSAYTIISNFAAFYESAELIRDEIERLFEGSLNALGRFETEVEIRYPTQSIFRELEYHQKQRGNRKIKPQYGEMVSLGQTRDGFFYFLLILSMIQFIAIGLLLYIAVTKTYFP